MNKSKAYEMGLIFLVGNYSNREKIREEAKAIRALGFKARIIGWEIYADEEYMMYKEIEDIKTKINLIPERLERAKNEYQNDIKRINESKCKLQNDLKRYTETRNRRIKSINSCKKSK